MKKALVLVCSLLFYSTTFAQQCETYAKELFHMLPKDFPKTINCTDSNNQKQGWWIEYRTYPNPVRASHFCSNKNYVDAYNYGEYKNGVKIGDWKRVSNVHSIYVADIENYHLGKDTTLITSYNPLRGNVEWTKYYNADSSIICFTKYLNKEGRQIQLKYNRKLTNNSLYVAEYKGHILRKFELHTIDAVFDQIGLLVGDEMEEVDRGIFKQNEE